MSKLRPSLWRTCRVLASETRLKLLWEIFADGECFVGELGRRVRISDQNASIQLRLLNSRGLISSRRSGMMVLYRTEPNEEVEFSKDLLNALRECCEREVPIRRVIRSATAFTHERRIRVVQLLSRSPLRPADLESRTGIGARALYRHLAKLEARGCVRRDHGLCRLAVPDNPLGVCLMKIICRTFPAVKTTVRVAKVVSGGQTGADRAALDAAIACGVPHGGWCPKGRLAEDGRIPERYELQEMETGNYAARTLANVDAADLTLIFSHGPLSGGSLLTQQFAEKAGKPCVHIDLNECFRSPVAGCSDAPVVFQRLEEMFSALGSCRRGDGLVLNVAGPRASGDPGIYDAVYEAMLLLLN
jgi:DNA-binding transcriptional ArsR family regulator